MSRWLLGAALVVVSFVPGVVAQSSEQEVLKAEQARVDARQKADAAAHAKIVSDDFLQVIANGQVRDKKYAVSLPAAAGMKISGLKTAILGDVAIVTGIQSGTAAAGAGARFTHLWRKQNGQWLNVFVQNTPITKAAPDNNSAAATATAKIPPTNWPQGKTQDEQDVLKVQQRLNEAFAKKDAAAYAELTADNFMRINADGSTTPKAEFLKAVAASPAVRRQVSNNSDIRIRAYGPVALVSYIDKNAAAAAGNRMSRVFTKQGGAWKQLVSQSTPITQP
jgi:hypothetical protein